MEHAKMTASLSTHRALIGRRALHLTVAAVAAISISACGDSKPKKPASTTTTPAASHAVSVAESKSVPLRVPISTVTARFGDPLRIEYNEAEIPGKTKNAKGRKVSVTDYIYLVKGGPAPGTIDFTFYKGKLASVLIKQTPKKKKP